MVANSYRVEVNYHPPTARAPLACHPRTTLHVVHASLDASHAGTLLVGTPSRSSHDLMPLARQRRGRIGRLCCGCRLAFIADDRTLRIAQEQGEVGGVEGAYRQRERAPAYPLPDASSPATLPYDSFTWACTFETARCSPASRGTRST